MDTTPVAAASIAVANRTLETASPITGPSPRLGPRLASSTFAHAFYRGNRSADLAEYVLPNVVLDTRTGLIFHEGRSIEESLMRQLGQMRPIDPNGLIRAPSDARAVLGFNGMQFNYFHWMTECLPAIHSAIFTTKTAASIVLRPLNSFQRQSLTLLGLDAMPSIAVGRDVQIAFDRLVYSTFHTDATRVTPSRLAQAMYRQMAAPYAECARTRQLFIRRGGANMARRMTNEDELAARMAAMGFEVLDLEALSLTTQIALFAQSRLIVGAHGAGLTNIVFSAPGTVVFELMPDTIVRVNFAALALASGLRYYGEHHPVTNGGTRNHDIIWNADIDDVVRTVNRIRDDLYHNETSF